MGKHLLPSSVKLSFGILPGHGRDAQHQSEVFPPLVAARLGAGLAGVLSKACKKFPPRNFTVTEDTPRLLWHNSRYFVEVERVE
jgi:hypothetical protein